MAPRILLVNPWIVDYAAYDLWSRPLGLLYLAAALKKAGGETRLVDCLDRLAPDSGAPRRRPSELQGTGRWRREALPGRSPLPGVPRRLCRYGAPGDVVRRSLADGPRPDLVLVASTMTYWYMGVQEAVALARQVWPEAPVVLGGAYATLCPDHARTAVAPDLLVEGPFEAAWGKIASLAGLPSRTMDRPPVPSPGLWPDLDLYPRLDFAPLLTSRGCPYACPYCASRRLFHGFVSRDPGDVLAEIEDRHRRLGVADFVFFDDALLADADRRLKPILESVINRGWRLRFHAPNGLHVGLIDRDLAGLMSRAGFRTIRLGLETLDPHRGRALGGKVAPGVFEAAASALKSAGIDPASIGVYVLWGLPGQPLEEVAATVAAVRARGFRPYLAEYSPLPGTALWNEAQAASPFDLAHEPLAHNNSIFPCRGPDFSWEKVWAIKREAVAP